jgi:hypothetical protein
MVSVAQREWAGKNPRATVKAPITVADVLNSRMIAYRSDASVLLDRWGGLPTRLPSQPEIGNIFRSSRRPRPRCLSISRRRQ